MSDHVDRPPGQGGEQVTEQPNVTKNPGVAGTLPSHRNSGLGSQSSSGSLPDIVVLGHDDQGKEADSNELETPRPDLIAAVTELDRHRSSSPEVIVRHSDDHQVVGSRGATPYLFSTKPAKSKTEAQQSIPVLPGQSSGLKSTPFNPYTSVNTALSQHNGLPHFHYIIKSNKSMRCGLCHERCRTEIYKCLECLQQVCRECVEVKVKAAQPGSQKVDWVGQKHRPLEVAWKHRELTRTAASAFEGIEPFEYTFSSAGQLLNRMVTFVTEDNTIGPRKNTNAPRKTVRFADDDDYEPQAAGTRKRKAVAEATDDYKAPPAPPRRGRSIQRERQNIVAQYIARERRSPQFASEQRRRGSQSNSILDSGTGESAVSSDIRKALTIPAGARLAEEEVHLNGSVAKTITEEKYLAKGVNLLGKPLTFTQKIWVQHNSLAPPESQIRFDVGDSFDQNGDWIGPGQVIFPASPTENESAGVQDVEQGEHLAETLKDANVLLNFSKAAMMNSAQPQTMVSASITKKIDAITLPAFRPTVADADEVEAAPGQSRLSRAIFQPTSKAPARLTRINMPQSSPASPIVTRHNEAGWNQPGGTTTSDTPGLRQASPGDEQSERIDRSTQTSDADRHTMKLTSNHEQIFHPRLGHVMITEPFEVQLIGTLGTRKLQPVKLSCRDPITKELIVFPVHEQTAQGRIGPLTHPDALFQPVLVPTSGEGHPTYFVGTRRSSVPITRGPIDLPALARNTNPSGGIRTPQNPTAVSVTQPHLGADHRTKAATRNHPAVPPGTNDRPATNTATRRRERLNHANVRAVNQRPSFVAPSRRAIAVDPTNVTSGQIIHPPTSGRLAELPFPRQSFKSLGRVPQEELEERYRKVKVVEERVKQ